MSLPRSCFIISERSSTSCGPFAIQDAIEKLSSLERRKSLGGLNEDEVLVWNLGWKAPLQLPQAKTRLVADLRRADWLMLSGATRAAPFIV